LHKEPQLAKGVEFESANSINALSRRSSRSFMLLAAEFDHTTSPDSLIDCAIKVTPSIIFDCSMHRCKAIALAINSKPFFLSLSAAAVSIVRCHSLLSSVHTAKFNSGESVVGASAVSWLLNYTATHLTLR